MWLPCVTVSSRPEKHQCLWCRQEHSGYTGQLWGLWTAGTMYSPDPSPCSQALPTPPHPCNFCKGQASRLWLRGGKGAASLAILSTHTLAQLLLWHVSLLSAHLSDHHCSTHGQPTPLLGDPQHGGLHRPAAPPSLEHHPQGSHISTVCPPAGTEVRDGQPGSARQLTYQLQTMEGSLQGSFPFYRGGKLRPRNALTILINSSSETPFACLHPLGPDGCPGVTLLWLLKASHTL